MHPVSSPSVLFLAFLRSGPSVVCCGSYLHTCHEETAVARHNIISAAEREGKACIDVPPLFTLPKSSAPGHLYNGRTFFYDKDVQKLPPPSKAPMAWTCNTIVTKPLGEQGC